MLNHDLQIKDARAWFRYLPVSREAKLIGAYVTSAGFAIVPPNVVYPPYEHGHPADHYFTWENGRVLHHYQFVYIAHGAGVFESAGGMQFAVHAGDLLILSPSVWHRYKPVVGTGWDEYWLEFDGEWVRRLMKREEFTREQPVLKIGGHDKFLDMFLEALQILRREPPQYQMLLGTLAMHLIAHAVSILNDRTYEDRSVAEIIREAKRWLTHNPLQPENLESLASRLNMSYSSFRRLFKSGTGFSPHQFVLEVRLNKASDLLARTDLPVYQVAQQCGMESVHYFSRLFRKKTGFTPTAYRLQRTTLLARNLTFGNPAPHQ